MIVSAKKQEPNGLISNIGVLLNDKKIRCHINHQLTKRRSELAYTLPIQIIHPKSFELLDSGPQIRREFLDWGVFHDNENFLLIFSK